MAIGTIPLLMLTIQIHMASLYLQDWVLREAVVRISPLLGVLSDCHRSFQRQQCNFGLYVRVGVRAIICSQLPELMHQASSAFMFR